MNPQKGHRRLARGAALWQAPRLKPVVKKHTVRERKKTRRQPSRHRARKSKA